LTNAVGWLHKKLTEKVENDYFTYAKNRRVKGNTLEIDFTAKTYKKSVSVEDSRQYIKDLEKLLDRSYFYSTYTDKAYQ